MHIVLQLELPTELCEILQCLEKALIGPSLRIFQDALLIGRLNTVLTRYYDLCRQVFQFHVITYSVLNRFLIVKALVGALLGHCKIS